nr:probable polygalacturonase [Tanacetum cinerariifolium]
MPKVYKNDKICITEFREVRDGKTLNTIAFTEAIHRIWTFEKDVLNFVASFLLMKLSRVVYEETKRYVLSSWDCYFSSLVLILMAMIVVKNVSSIYCRYQVSATQAMDVPDNERRKTGVKYGGDEKKELLVESRVLIPEMTFVGVESMVLIPETTFVDVESRVLILETTFVGVESRTSKTIFVESRVSSLETTFVESKVHGAFARYSDITVATYDTSLNYLS